MRSLFHFMPSLLKSGELAHEASFGSRWPTFMRPDWDFSHRSGEFERDVSNRLGSFISVRGGLKRRELLREIDAVSRHLWHTRALLGFLEDQKTFFGLSQGHIPTLARLERPRERDFHQRVFDNFPIFGVGAATLLQLGVPLPWNMVAGAAAVAAREYSESHRRNRVFEKELRRQFAAQGRVPDLYVDLYRQLDCLIPHPLREDGEALSRTQRLENLKALKRFKRHLDEVHWFVSAYAMGLKALEADPASGRTGFRLRQDGDERVGRAVDLMMDQLRGSQRQAASVPEAGSSACEELPLTAECVGRIRKAVQGAEAVVGPGRTALLKKS